MMRKNDRKNVSSKATFVFILGLAGLLYIQSKIPATERQLNKAAHEEALEKAAAADKIVRAQVDSRTSAPGLPALANAQSPSAPKGAPETPDVEKTPLQRILLKAESLYSDSRRNDAAEAEVRDYAKRLTAADVKRLTATVLNPSAAPTSRDASLYILTEAGPVTLPALAHIAATPFTEPPATHRPETRDTTLRITALEAIDRYAGEDARATALLEKVLKQQKDPTLQMLTQISLTGIAQGRPGKLGRMMDVFVEGKDAL